MGLRDAIILAAALLCTACATTPEATHERDAEAKEFEPVTRDAVIYVYRPGSTLGSPETTLWTDRRLVGSSLPGTFFRVLVWPGRNVIDTSPPDTGRIVDRPARRAHPLDRNVDLEQRLRRIASRILDRKPGHPGLDGETHALPDAGRIRRVAVLEVRVHRQLGRRDELAKVRQYQVTRSGAIAMADRPGKTGARRSKRLEPKARQIARAADVPGIRNDEASRFVQLPKSPPLVGNATHAPAHLRTDCKSRSSANPSRASTCARSKISS
jgi:hypothetical protein